MREQTVAAFFDLVDTELNFKDVRLKEMKKIKKSARRYEFRKEISFSFLLNILVDKSELDFLRTTYFNQTKDFHPFEVFFSALVFRNGNCFLESIYDGVCLEVSKESVVLFDQGSCSN